MTPISAQPAKKVRTAPPLRHRMDKGISPVNRAAHDRFYAKKFAQDAKLATKK
jgi:hypothetical protein